MLLSIEQVLSILYVASLTSFAAGVEGAASSGVEPPPVFMLSSASTGERRGSNRFAVEIKLSIIECRRFSSEESSPGRSLGSRMVDTFAKEDVDSIKTK